MMERSYLAQRLGFLALRLCFLSVVLTLLFILLFLIWKGLPALSLTFLTSAPRNGMLEGGIFPAIMGTLLLTGLVALFSIPLGLSTAIYLNEYVTHKLLARCIRIALRNLSGVPSIIFGLFGVALFVRFLQFGASLLSAALTLAVMTLPWIVTAAEEALRSVPLSYRQGALALGATKWQMIRTTVLPTALPGMLTGTIIGLGRAAGETAPILFTGAAFFLPRIPTSAFDQFMALPYHLYVLATQHHAIDQARTLAYGTALVLIMLVFGVNLAAILGRSYLRRHRRI